MKFLGFCQGSDVSVLVLEAKQLMDELRYYNYRCDQALYRIEAVLRELGLIGIFMTVRAMVGRTYSL